MGGDSQEWVQKRIRPEVFPPVDAAAEVLLHPAGSGVLAAADEFSVNIHLIPGNLIDQHRRPHDFQVVGSLHSCFISCCSGEQASSIYFFASSRMICLSVMGDPFTAGRPGGFPAPSADIRRGWGGDGLRSRIPGQSGWGPPGHAKPGQNRCSRRSDLLCG